MSTIRIIYSDHEPNFPATDQHPDAKRYYVMKDGSIVAAPLRGIPGTEIPASANDQLPEEERVRLAAIEGQRAREAKDRLAAAPVRAKPVYVVDALGEPTMEEILKVLDASQKATSFSTGE